MTQTRDQLIGCVPCIALFAVVGLVAYPKYRADSNVRKAGEGSSTIRLMAHAHAAKPEVTSFRFDLGKGGDAGWKALGLPEDAKWHSYEGWVAGDGLWLVATGNLDEDEALDEWEWSPAVSSPVEIARRRAIYGTSLTARFQVEEIADRETQHKMRSGDWLAFEDGDPAAFSTLSVKAYSKGSQYHYSAIASNGALVVEGSADLDGTRASIARSRVPRIARPCT